MRRWTTERRYNIWLSGVQTTNCPKHHQNQGVDFRRTRKTTQVWMCGEHQISGNPHHKRSDMVPQYLSLGEESTTKTLLPEETQEEKISRSAPGQLLQHYQRDVILCHCASVTPAALCQTRRTWHWWLNLLWGLSEAPNSGYNIC